MPAHGYLENYLRAIHHPLKPLEESFRAEFSFLFPLLSKDDIILGVGCEAGDPAIRLASHASKIICVDNDKELLLHAMQRCAYIPNVMFKFGDVVKLDMDSNSVDFSFATYNLAGSLDETEREWMIKEMARVTKQGGHVFNSTWKNDLETTAFLKEYYPSIGIAINEIDSHRTVTNKGIFERIDPKK